jgi:hypothetical protein
VPGAVSALQQRFDLLVEFLEWRPAHDLLAIDEEGRLAVDPESFEEGWRR